MHGMWIRTKKLPVAPLPLGHLSVYSTWYAIILVNVCSYAGWAGGGAAQCSGIQHKHAQPALLSHSRWERRAKGPFLKRNAPWDVACSGKVSGSKWNLGEICKLTFRPKWADGGT